MKKNSFSTFTVVTTKIHIKTVYRKLSVIDLAGVLTVVDISDGVGRSSVPADANKLERKDVWSMCWASDNPQLLAIMEKTRMYIFKGSSPEEPIACSGYIYSFNVSFYFIKFVVHLYI